MGLSLIEGSQFTRQTPSLHTEDVSFFDGGHLYTSKVGRCEFPGSMRLHHKVTGKMSMVGDPMLFDGEKTPKHVEAHIAG